MNRTLKIFFSILFLILLIVQNGYSQVRLPRLVSDGMILQRETPVKIWGWAGAVGYFFARELYEKYKVPVGIIQCAAGGSSDESWISEESLKAFPVPDRFGFSIVAGHGHCQLPKSQYPEVEAFVEKFLLGNTSANTNVTISPYSQVDYSRWFKWWGTGKPVFTNN